MIFLDFPGGKSWISVQLNELLTRSFIRESLTLLSKKTRWRFCQVDLLLRGKFCQIVHDLRQFIQSFSLQLCK